MFDSTYVMETKQTVSFKPHLPRNFDPSSTLQVAYIVQIALVDRDEHAGRHYGDDPRTSSNDGFGSFLLFKT